MRSLIHDNACGSVEVQFQGNSNGTKPFREGHLLSDLADGFAHKTTDIFCEHEVGCLVGISHSKAAYVIYANQAVVIFGLH